MGVPLEDEPVEDEEDDVDEPPPPLLLPLPPLLDEASPVEDDEAQPRVSARPRTNRRTQPC
jgi:hypothetical protein